MSVHSINGALINSAYVYNGSNLESAYSIDGAQVFTSSYSIDNVESYFRAETLSVANEVNALSNDWQSFVFITDMHGNGNKQHSQAIGLYLLNNTPVSMIVLGGDYSVNNWSKTEYDTYMLPLLTSGLNSDIYAVMGNHETFGGGSSEAKASIYNDFLHDKTTISGDLRENYYYLDNAEKKTRYIFLNTSDESAYVVSSAQLAWIANRVLLPDTDWHLVVIGHVNLLQMGGVTTLNESNGSDIVNAIDGCNGNIVGYFCGHQHVDICEKLGNFQHTTLMVDKFENTNYYNGISVTNRVIGTDSEQAVSVVSINTTTKDVVIRRIGAGRNRTISYSYAN